MSSPAATAANTAEPQYRSFRWFVLATLLIVTATTALALICPAPLVGDITETSDGLTTGEVTWMTMGTFNLFVAISALGGGYFVDKFGFIKIYIIGIILISIGWFLMPIIGGGYWGMVLIRVLQGVGTGPVMASTASVAAKYFPSKERGIVTGTQGAAMSLGLATGVLVVPMLMESKGDWQIALRSLWPAALLALIMALIVAFGPSAAPSVATAPKGPASASEKAALKAAMLNPLTWVAIGCVVLLSWVYQAFNDLTPGYLTIAAPKGLGLEHGSALLVWAQLANMVGSFACGMVTERIFRGRVRPGIILGFLFGSIGGACLLLSAVKSNEGLLVASLMLAGFFYAWINPNAIAYIAKFYPENITGKLGGLAMGIGIFGGTAGVAAGSAALHATDRYVMSIIIMVVVGLLGLVVALALRQPKSTEQGSLAAAQAAAEQS